MARLSPAVFGRSGRLRALIADPSRALGLPLEWSVTPPADVWYQWRPVAGTRPPLLLGSSRLSMGLQAPPSNGVWKLHLSAGAWTQDLDAVSVITRVPFDIKRDGYLNGYHIGRYPTEDPARVHEANFNYLSLWYTAGRDYGLHDGEWKMTGGAANADSILVASEPLTRDVASWVEVPEYSILHVQIRNGRPVVTLHYLD